jgi:hypothetical protein
MTASAIAQQLEWGEWTLSWTFLVGGAEVEADHLTIVAVKPCCGADFVSRFFAVQHGTGRNPACRYANPFRERSGSLTAGQNGFKRESIDTRIEIQQLRLSRSAQLNPAHGGGVRPFTQLHESKPFSNKDALCGSRAHLSLERTFRTEWEKSRDSS